MREDVLINVRTLVQTKQLAKLLLMLEEMKKVGIPTAKAMKELGGRYKGLVPQAKKLIPIMKRFKFEMLGVMFFGMGIARLFSQMTAGALEMTGVTEMLGMTMNLITLEALLPWLDTIYENIIALMNMDASAKALIGTLMFLGQGAGLLLQTFGMLVLGVTSLVMAFPGIKTVALPVLGTLFSIMGTFIGTVLPEGTEQLKALKTGLMALGPAVTAAGIFSGVKEVGGFIQKIKITGDASQFLSVINRLPHNVGILISKYGWQMLGGAVIITSIINLAKTIQSEATPLEYLDIIATAVGGALIAWAPSPIGKAIGITLVLIPTIAPGAMADVVETIIRGAQRVWHWVITGKEMPVPGGWKYTPPFMHDFIWRPGEGAIQISPRDTLIGLQSGTASVNFSPTVNITASVSSDIDIADLAGRLSDYWRDDLRRMVA